MMERMTFKVVFYSAWAVFWLMIFADLTGGW